ncbi:MAG: type I 3-dehydroquinate dehydratase [Desulfobacterales bacterium]|nr:type I 3-dehydroquinate dehydratase [Desulfobacterales bacterium]
MICIPIMAGNNAEALEKMLKASSLADMMEIRLDIMESFNLDEIIQKASKPLIVTYRSKKEGGKGLARYETRIRYLIAAGKSGADFIDVEHSIPFEYRREIFRMVSPSRIIISAHMSNKTPSQERLEDMLRKMAATGAGIVKIITMATGPEDNLRVMELIPMAQKLGVKIITFCMGPMGRISRIACPILGGYLTFASLEQGQESASGQIPVKEMRKILGELNLGFTHK